MSDWQPTGVGEPAEELVVADLALIGEVAHPIRGPLYRRLKLPRSAAELAELLGVPVTRLYHHLNQLEARGLIRVVATRRVGAVTERRYQVVAKSLRLDEAVVEHLAPGELARASGALFDGAKLGLGRAIEAGRFPGRPAGATADHGLLSFTEVTLPVARRGEFVERLKQLIDEFNELDSPEGQAPGGPAVERFTLFVAAYPVVD